MKTLNQEYIKPLDCDDNNRDFEFEFSFAFGYKQLHETPLFVYADELFDSGMIKPLKVFKDSDPLLPKGKQQKSSKPSFQPKDSRSTLLSGVHKLSSNFPANIQLDSKKIVDKSSLGSRSLSQSSNKKWKLKDLLLFRSVSEGHASTRDNHGRKCQETARLEFNDWSNFSPVKNGHERRRRQGKSAYERHYRSNRRAGEEMKRKTFLPYKKTLLMGCSDLDPGVYEFCKGHAVEI